MGGSVPEQVRVASRNNTVAPRGKHLNHSSRQGDAVAARARAEGQPTAWGQDRLPGWGGFSSRRPGDLRWTDTRYDGRSFEAGVS